MKSIVIAGNIGKNAEVREAGQNKVQIIGNLGRDPEH